MYLPSLQFDITEVTFLHTHSLLQLEKNSSKKISSKREKVRKSKKEKENMFRQMSWKLESKISGMGGFYKKKKIS